MATYREAGVDLEGADRHVAAIGSLVTATWGNNVVGGFGGFAAGVELPPGYRQPVLMLSTDGVGTKLELARRTGIWSGVGFDLVAMCVDDLAAAGARPLGFVDYLAVGALDAERDATIVGSVASACATAGCALLGGETAEHPGVMAADQVDLAGAALGVVDKGSEITGESVSEGDVIVGLISPNLRSNGFSLVRKVIEGLSLGSTCPGTDTTWAEVLLQPSLIYSPSLQRVADRVKAAAHVTGGGIPGNLVRSLPRGVKARVRQEAWSVPAVFRLIQERGGIPDQEMFNTFNMGIGFCLVIDPADADSVASDLGAAGSEAVIIGEIAGGDRAVELV